MKKINTLFFLILFSYSTFAQIVNIEKKRKNLNGFQATTALNFNIKNNGSRIIELANSADIQYSHKAHTIIFLNNIKLLNIDKGSFVNNGFQHLRYNYTVKDSSFLTLEAFGQYQYNEQKLLQKRILSGGGPRFAIFRKKNFSLYFAPLAMFEYELYTDSARTETKSVRLDSYTNMHFSINDFVSFNLITYFQPVFNNFSDYRISGETGIRFKISKHLAYNVSYSLDFDNQPPENIQKIFWNLNNGLIIKL